MKTITLSVLFLNLLACSTSYSQKNSAEFDNYWFDSKAEITSYQLTQARYGEKHDGKAVLIFVSEPFSISKQVKLDDWNKKSDRVDVLKLNMTKKFLTGIYPYSMMMSTFTPISLQETTQLLKVSTSSQEWCGHTFLQGNRKEKSDYLIKSYSYFESEGDKEVKVNNALIEDQVWTTIRQNPYLLPIGDFKMLPSTFYLRLKHIPVTAQDVKAKLTSVDSDFAEDTHQKYSLVYPDRTLDIFFEKDFPYTIFGWEETYTSGFSNPQKMTTVAKRIKSIRTPYWTQNKQEDRKIREQLHLK